MKHVWFRFAVGAGVFDIFSIIALIKGSACYIIGSKIFFLPV
jgi:hypothetical protein